MLKTSFKQGKDGPDESRTFAKACRCQDAQHMGECKQHFLVYQLRL